MGMNTVYQSIESLLAGFSGRSHCRMTSRGATAIYVALRVVGEAKGYGDVIVPSIGCLSIPQAVKLAGHNPVFADVDPLTGCLSVEDTQKRSGRKTKAILPIHIFGHAVEIAKVCELASTLGAAVIEDACHALGGTADGRRIGSWGMFSIGSFGGTKSLGGLGGGALLFDDANFLPLVESIVSSLPVWPTESVLELLALSHRNLYHGVVDYRRATGQQAASMTAGDTAEAYRALLLSGDPVPQKALEAIQVGIQNAAASDQKRLDVARFYDAVLASTPCQRLPMSVLEKTGTVWRYTFTCPNPIAAQSLTSALRKAGLHASNQFWSLAEIWEGNEKLSGAKWFQDRVVNLWVDRAATTEYLDLTAKVINQWNSRL
jgi:dTDP-4-amino-4,6-dideoxygalactose transaminase